MFARVLFAHWQLLLAGALWLGTAGVYALVVRRALRMRPDQAARLARLPLADESPVSSSPLRHESSP